MPRKKPEQLKSKSAPAPAAKEQPVVSAPVAAPIAPAPAPQNTGYHPADINGDGHIDAEEKQMELEFRRKALEDADAMRDAQRKMTWFALLGMLLYPAGIFITSILGQEKAATIIGDIAPTYFVAISALVAAYFGANAYTDKKK